MVKERKATIKSLYCDKCGTEMTEKKIGVFILQNDIYINVQNVRVK